MLAITLLKVTLVMVTVHEAQPNCFDPGPLRRLEVCTIVVACNASSFAN